MATRLVHKNVSIKVKQKHEFMEDLLLTLVQISFSLYKIKPNPTSNFSSTNQWSSVFKPPIVMDASLPHNSTMEAYSNTSQNTRSPILVRHHTSIVRKFGRIRELSYSERTVGSGIHDDAHRKERLKLKRGLSGTIDGLEVSALADTGAAQNVVSSNFAGALKLDVAGSLSLFRQGNSTFAHSLGTSKYRFDTITK